jgi:hypothetical protein
MKETLTREMVETGTLIFWDPIIRRALTEQSSLQWIFSAKPVFGRIYDLCLIAKVSEGWYISDRPQTPGAFAYPVNLRFAQPPVFQFDCAVESMNPEGGRLLKQTQCPPFRRKLCFAQRVEVPRGRAALTGQIVYDVYKNEVRQPTAHTPFSIPLKE